MNYTAPASNFAAMLATGKPLITHIIPNPEAAIEAFSKGSNGLMVSGVTQVVPHHQ